MTEQDQLKQRLQRLEDIEALRQLKYRYFAACDANYDAEGVALLFTEDGVWDAGEFGRYEGRAAIFSGFSEKRFSVKFAFHYGMNPTIAVTGDTAVCRWYLWLIKINNAGDQRELIVGTYQDLCVRQAGQWLFKRIVLDTPALPISEGSRT